MHKNILKLDSANIIFRLDKMAIIAYEMNHSFVNFKKRFALYYQMVFKKSKVFSNSSKLVQTRRKPENVSKMAKFVEKILRLLKST